MAEQKKFSLAKVVAGNKRAAESSQPVVKKMPKVSEMTAAEQRPQRVVTNAPVVVCVYPVISWHIPGAFADLWL